MGEITIGQALLILIDHYTQKEAALTAAMKQNLGEEKQKDMKKLQKKYLENDEVLTELKRLYVCGVITADDKSFLFHVTRDDALDKYTINMSDEAINEDPSRRYFETHLAYETLARFLQKIDLKNLREHFDIFMEDILRGENDKSRAVVKQALNGDVEQYYIFDMILLKKDYFLQEQKKLDKKLDDMQDLIPSLRMLAAKHQDTLPILFQEGKDIFIYGKVSDDKWAITKLNSMKLPPEELPEFPQDRRPFILEKSQKYAKLYAEIRAKHANEPFSTMLEFNDALHRISVEKNYQALYEKIPDNKEKMELLIKLAYEGIVLTNKFKSEIPLESAYKSYYFFSENRGRVTKAHRIPSLHMGLMGTLHPVPQGDITAAELPFDPIRPAERSTFESGAGWVVDNFKRLVHPFSNSVSGTFLAQMRLLKWLNLRDELQFKDLDSIENFIKCFISLLLYNSGGHSFNEFVEILNIPGMKGAFYFIEDFQKLNLETLFVQGTENRLALDKVLANTIRYNNLLLKRANLRKEIISYDITVMSIAAEEKLPSLEELKIEAQKAGNTPILIKEGRNFWMYGCSSTGEWQLREVNVNFHVGFPKVGGKSILKKADINLKVFADLAAQEAHVVKRSTLKNIKLAKSPKGNYWADLLNDAIANYKEKQNVNAKENPVIKILEETLALLHDKADRPHLNIKLVILLVAVLKSDPQNKAKQSTPGLFKTEEVHLGDELNELIAERHINVNKKITSENKIEPTSTDQLKVMENILQNLAAKLEPTLSQTDIQAKVDEIVLLCRAKDKIEESKTANDIPKKILDILNSIDRPTALPKNIP